jgi:hypothetical protein
VINAVVMFGGVKDDLKRAAIARKAPCPYGGERLSWDDVTIDHIKPKALGGKSDITNYAVVCDYHNQLKSDTPLHEIVKENAQVTHSIRTYLNAMRGVIIQWGEYSHQVRPTFSREAKVLFFA